MSKVGGAKLSEYLQGAAVILILSALWVLATLAFVGSLSIVSSRSMPGSEPAQTDVGHTDYGH